ncbi:MAG TPA: hypothetical protein VGJ26_15410 [Pirellulales bacterium]|jgi:hypothetical protein
MKRYVVPDLYVEIMLSDRLYDLVGGLNARGQLRVWNNIAKSAMSEELVKHHKRRIPGHFKRGAASKYGYMRRTDKYQQIKFKIWRSETDLVKTGRTRLFITAGRQIRIVGGASSSRTWGAIIGQLVMRLPFPGTRENPLSKGVSINQMKKEITATTDEERSDMQFGFLDRVQQKFAKFEGGQRMFYRSK